jgi:hypothetical protein
MVKIQSPEMQHSIYNATRYNPSENIISEFADKVVLTAEVNPLMFPELWKIANTGGSTTGNLTILAANASNTKERFMVGASLAFIKDVTCDMATGALTIQAVLDNGINSAILQLPTLTLTAQSSQLYVSFTRPIKFSSTDVVTVSGTFAAGACMRSASIYYFEIER